MGVTLRGSWTQARHPHALRVCNPVTDTAPADPVSEACASILKLGWCERVCIFIIKILTVLPFEVDGQMI